MSKYSWYSDAGVACSWWLRSTGAYKDLYMSYVDKGGNVSAGGQVYYSSCDICVRPVLWMQFE